MKDGESQKSFGTIRIGTTRTVDVSTRVFALSATLATFKPRIFRCLPLKPEQIQSRGFGIQIAFSRRMKTRIEELRQRIREATGQNPWFEKNAECPPEIEEEFLEHVLAFETSPRRTPFDLLEELEVELPQPGKLSDGALTKKLWEVICALLSRSIVVDNTDHLSDRELYSLLWNETLREELVLCPLCTIHLDMTETGVENGESTYLKYYASEEQRQQYLQIQPDFEMPEHVEPPRRRDHLIPHVPPPATRQKNVH
jgi:23S rRNA U2552 (ribose-2'-O)-methylase RlmE/FtsJ